MLEHIKIHQLNDFFLDLDKRSVKGVFFYRICGYNAEIHNFITEYYNAARMSGVIIENKIANPDEKNLSYYNEIMGQDFQMSAEFFNQRLSKWLPRMTPTQRKNVADSLFATLMKLKQEGKNDNMLKNAYVKMMCWLYYKFERIVNQLGNNQIPKILYQGNVSNYELILLSILSTAGCDIVLLQYGGDSAYLSVDASSARSDKLEMQNQTAFPQDFSLETIKKEIVKKANRARMYGKEPEIINCTNAWCSGKFYEDILTPPSSRGTDSRFFYNCFFRMNGVEDKVTYQNELAHLNAELEKSGRKKLIINKSIPMPTPDEIASVKRENYPDTEKMLSDLSAKTGFTGTPILSSVIRKAFIDTLLEAEKNYSLNLNKLMNKAVYLICWFRRYQSKLNIKPNEIPCFILFGPCLTDNEALFIKFLAKLPIDVIIFNPSLKAKCCVEDNVLFEVNYTTPLDIEQFPDCTSNIRVGTAAYHAERELDTMMYQDSGMYRNMQHGKAMPVILSTMYEEIAILWDQELKYRPNFSTENDTVMMPVIFAKVSGVKDSQLTQYWSDIKSLVTPETYLIKTTPFVPPGNSVKPFAAEFLKNGKLQREKIRSHKCYQYGFLRESMQEHILDKIQLLIDRKLIKGTFQNGTEYTIVSVALSMKTEIVRLIQRFDFTKKNPKIIYINTSEKLISLEDSILTALLSLIGFDVLFFVPTGYRTVENHFNGDVIEEHQAGNYLYDLHIPDFRLIQSSTRQSWRDKIFKRGT